MTGMQSQSIPSRYNKLLLCRARKEQVDLIKSSTCSKKVEEEWKSERDETNQRRSKVITATSFSWPLLFTTFFASTTLDALSVLPLLSVTKRVSCSRRTEVCTIEAKLHKRCSLLSSLTTEKVCMFI